MASDKTEKATPKKREETRKRGQVARSADLTGAVVLFASLQVLGMTGPKMGARMQETMEWALRTTAHPDIVSQEGVGTVLLFALKQTGLALAPILAVCAIAGVLVNVAMVKWKPSIGALKPELQRINPISGAKNIFGPNAAVEGAKSVLKVLAVAAIVALALVPQLPAMGAMVGMEPGQLAGALVSNAMAIAKRAAIAYFVIGVIDMVWQKYRHEKSMRMDKQEVKDEAKQQQLPAEVRSAIRRRQMQASRARMMAAVPEADVVVVNPTHYAVALKYDGTSPAPEVVAKGVDLVAARIREIAKEAGVAIVPDPPLARALHASVEVGQQIPEALFGAVAQVLAFVYRMNRQSGGVRRRAAAPAGASAAPATA
ncbi:MAG TPA: flagellar biosynthesis protein FlhB [Capillimicrobium sp.]|nr:flagellar biosynthesis protein FlhB [Capillimicrobium sp.]